MNPSNGNDAGTSGAIAFDDPDQKPETVIKTSQTWMPMANDQVVPLAALSVCHVNVDQGCDFHIQQKYRSYMNTWKNPAPKHCQKKKAVEPEIVIHSDRLGVELNCD